MGYRRRLSSVGFVTLTVLVSFATMSTVAADVFTSTSYEIDASVSGNFGGQTSSTNYKMVASGGESIIGNGTGGSYKMGQGYVAQLDKSLQLVVQPANLIGYWPFEEGIGIRAFDNSASQNHGELRDGPTWGTGKISGGIALDGTNDRVVIDNPNTFRYMGTNRTMSTWVKPSNSESTTAYLISKPWNGAVYNYFMQLTASRQIVLYVSSPGAISHAVTSTGTIPLDSWSHIAGVLKTDGTMEIYINGSLDGSDVHEIENWSDGSDSAIPLQLGCLSSQAAGWGGNTAQCFDGSLDETKIYSRALSAAEVKAEYDAQNAGISSGLSLNTITPGASQTAIFDAIVQTDAPGYDLSINQDHDLQFGANTIPGVPGSIASPVTWNESVTKGLGFTLYGTNATAIPGKWSSGAAYAAIPSSSTAFYTRSDYTAGGKDVLNLRLRSDVANTQPSGFYSNTMTITGTMVP